MSSPVKRPPDDSNSPPDPAGLCPPPTKKKKLVIEPLRIGPISTLEEMDIKVLHFQHKKIKQRLEARQRLEEELKEQIEKLEIRQTQDDAVLNVINRYWNQLNEDIRILLQRFDAETSDELESKNESEATTSFLTQLSTWDKEELDAKLVNRVQVSTRAVAKIIQAFDRLQQRSEKISKALKAADTSGESPDGAPTLDDAVKEAYTELEQENRKLQALNISLHKSYHKMSLKIKELSDQLSSEVTKGDELKNRLDDLTYEMQKLVSRNDKLTTHIQELTEKYRKLQQNAGSTTEEKKECDFKVDISDSEVLNLQKDNEELKELANNRLMELDNLHQNHKETLKELERLKINIRNLPESVIVETTEYKCLQSKFSVLYNESNQLRASFEEARQSAFQMKAQQQKYNDIMESEEQATHKKLRGEMSHLEEMLGQVRKEYEMLRIEFEQNLTANEQTGPINREMRHLITSLQNHNKQLKGDSQRYRLKYKELGIEMGKLKRDRDHMEAKLNMFMERDNLRRRNNSGLDGYQDDDSPSSSNQSKPDPCSPFEEKMNHDGETSNDSMDGMKNDKMHNDIQGKKEIKRETKSPRNECETMKDLRSQLKKALNEQRETKLLLDMYKGSSRDQRDRVQLMASERKCRSEIEELRLIVKRYQEHKKDEKKKLADDDAVKRIRVLEEQVHNLQKQVANQKLEEDALINEMEVTGQAFEDMQEQNSRLIQQLREKDDANFKLMSDRIKSNQVQKFAREEKDLLQDRINFMTNQLESQSLVVRKLEEKERLVVSSISAMEKESSQRLQASEGYKRKAIESAQSAADLKLHLEKYHSQMKDAQLTVTEKTSALEAEAYKSKRLQEEIALLRRKVERLNKIDIAGNSDEVMLEEIREYKETLTCPSCKVKRKDAVLTKCFHVFCFDCLRTRYETRQRKCPKCNAAFGANDYHRLYLT